MITRINHVLGPTDGRNLQVGGLGVRHMIEATRTDGSFTLLEHPLDAHSLGSPVHTHTREDEYSYVLEGTIGVQIGGEVLDATPGDLVFKPRGVPHAFWNATDEPARLLELIAPSGFERFFDEIVPMFPDDGPPDLEAFAAVCERYGLIMELETIEPLMERYGLVNV